MATARHKGLRRESRREEVSGQRLEGSSHTSEARWAEQWLAVPAILRVSTNDKCACHSSTWTFAVAKKGMSILYSCPGSPSRPKPPGVPVSFVVLRRLLFISRCVNKQFLTQKTR